MAKNKEVKVYVVVKPSHICEESGDCEVYDGSQVRIFSTKKSAQDYARQFAGYTVEEEVVHDK